MKKQDVQTKLAQQLSDELTKLENDYIVNLSLMAEESGLITYLVWCHLKNFKEKSFDGDFSDMSMYGVEFEAWIPEDDYIDCNDKQSLREYFVDKCLHELLEIHKKIASKRKRPDTIRD